MNLTRDENEWGGKERSAEQVFGKMASSECGRVLRKRGNTLRDTVSRGTPNRSWLSTPLWIESRSGEIESRSRGRVDPRIAGSGVRAYREEREWSRSLFECG